MERCKHPSKSGKTLKNTNKIGPLSTGKKGEITSEEGKGTVKTNILALSGKTNVSRILILKHTATCAKRKYIYLLAHGGIEL